MINIPSRTLICFYSSLKLAVLFGLTVSLLGCGAIIASSLEPSITDNEIVDRTAAYFGTDRNNIDVASIKKVELGTVYQVRYSGKFYNCEIVYGQVTCSQPGGG